MTPTVIERRSTVAAPAERVWDRVVTPEGINDELLLRIAELDEGTRFLEESTMLSMSRWRHERTVTPDGDAASVVHDRVTFQPRLLLRIAAPVLAVGIRALFAHRHRRLQRFFG
jgi:ligand-binding SRPBCC domain-containing protein